MSDTSMIRISTKLKEQLKEHARANGRTLEWVANDAINKYISAEAYTVTMPRKEHLIKPWNDVQLPEPTYTELEETA